MDDADRIARAVPVDTGGFFPVECCFKCRFWVPWDSDEAQGYCHKGPPSAGGDYLRLIAFMLASDPRFAEAFGDPTDADLLHLLDVSKIGHWPLAGDEDWCGAFERRGAPSDG